MQMLYSLNFLGEDILNLFAMDILNWMQLTKFTITKGCSADPMEPKMFLKPNPFKKRLLF